MTDTKSQTKQDQAIELEEAKLDDVAGGGRGNPVGGISDGTSNISDGTSNTKTKGIVHTGDLT